MRKVFFFTIIALLLSCNKEQSVTNSEVDQTSIGYKHNYYLASIFDKLSTPHTRADPNQVSRDEAICAALQSVEECLNAAGLEDSHRNEIIAYTTKILDGEITLDYEEVNHLLSDNQRLLAQELDAIFEDGDMDLTSLKQRVATIETRAKLLLTGDELELILNGCSVATNTLDYWHLSAADWIALAKIPTTRSSFPWKGLGRADVKGAITGGVGGLGATLLKCGPVGWKAWGALVLCSALVSSADYAFEQVCESSTPPKRKDDGDQTIIIQNPEITW